MRKTRSFPVAIAVVLSATLVAVCLVSGCGSRKTTVKLPSGKQTTVDKISDFPVETAEGQPSIDPATYRLKVEGLVETPLSLSLDDIKAIPAEVRNVKLPCVEGWTKAGLWKGPRLSAVLERAGVKKDAQTVVFSSPGGYTTSLTLADVKATDPLLAYDVNGDPLPPEHGTPCGWWCRTNSVTSGSSGSLTSSLSRATIRATGRAGATPTPPMPRGGRTDPRSCLLSIMGSCLTVVERKRDSNAKLERRIEQISNE